MKTNSTASVGDDLLKQFQKSEANLDRANLLLSINRKIAALTNLNEILRSIRGIRNTDSEKYRKTKLEIVNSFDDLNHYAYRAIVGDNFET